MTKIKDIAKVDRPREKMLHKGPEALTETELLAIILGSGIPGMNVKKLSEHILRKFRKTFLEITVDDLLEVKGIGKAKALQIIAAIQLVKRFTEKERAGEVMVNCLDDILSLTADLRTKRQEHLVCIYLNARNIVIQKETVSIGTVSNTIFHPREIFAPAIEMRATGIVLVHNHPSGETEPSRADLQMLDKVIKGAGMLGIRVVDFIIVAGTQTYSCLDHVKNKSNDKPDQDTPKRIDYIAEGEVQGLDEFITSADEPLIPALSELML